MKFKVSLNMILNCETCRKGVVFGVFESDTFKSDVVAVAMLPTVCV